MSSRRPTSAPAALVAVAGVLVMGTAGCAIDDGTPGPAASVLEPQPVDPTLTSGLQSVSSGVDLGLDACALLDLPAPKIAELTGADVDDATPVSQPDLRDQCSYGGPAYAARTTVTAVPAPPGPDLVAAGVVVPPGPLARAIAAQPAQLGPRLSCSPMRGTGGTPGGSPAPVFPDLTGPYVDCVAAPTGGGTEAHLVIAVGSRMWHLATVRPGTLRTPESEQAAMGGLHKVAAALAAR